MDEFDLGPIASDSALEQLGKMAREAMALQEAIDRMELDVKGAKAALHALRSVRLPALMAAASMDEATFDGINLKAKDFVSGSLTKDPQQREKAINWLVANGAGGLLKTVITASFGRSEKEEADRAISLLKEAGIAADAELSVHAGTLCAFARQRIADGENVEAELLGLYVGRVVEIKEKK